MNSSNTNKAKYPKPIHRGTTFDPMAGISVYRDVLAFHGVKDAEGLDESDGTYYLDFSVPGWNKRDDNQAIHIRVSKKLPTCGDCGSVFQQSGMHCVCTRCHKTFRVCEKCLEKDDLDLCNCLTAEDD